MSIVHTERVQCSCGVPVEVPTIDSINPVRNPHHKRALLDRTLHVFTCGACGRGLVVEKPLLYLDFERQQFFCMYPRSERHREEALAAEVRLAYDKWLGEQAPRFVQQLAREFLCRVCFGYEELREKVVIDDAGLADLVVEAMKIELILAEPWFAQSMVLTLRLDAVLPDGKLRLLPELADGQVWFGGRVATATREIYDEVDGRFDEILKIHPGLAKGPHVSVLRLAR